MGENPGEYFTTEQFDALRECDEGDKFYTLAGLETEDISLGMAVPPTGDLGKAALFLSNALRLTALPKWPIGKDSILCGIIFCWHRWLF